MRRLRARTSALTQTAHPTIGQVSPAGVVCGWGSLEAGVRTATWLFDSAHPLPEKKTSKKSVRDVDHDLPIFRS